MEYNIEKNPQYPNNVAPKRTPKPISLIYRNGDTNLQSSKNNKDSENTEERKTVIQEQ